MLRNLRDHYLRIDLRSLGVFRVAMAAVLIGDLFRRWAWVRDFYSNEGVLPNHNHLFNLRDKGQVWSVLHAFSTPGENHFAFGVILLVYLFFLLGYKTRVFHALALTAIVSLNARNILTENAGTYAAIAVLAFTFFLPCGRRVSLDALRDAMQARHEKRAADLNERARLPIETESPTSIAALAVLVQIAAIFLVTALQQKGAPWRDGTALHYALHVERWVSGTGAAIRGGAPPGLLRGLTHLLYVSGFAIPILIALPVLRRQARASAAILMLLHGVILGMLFDLGLYGWTLAAAAPLVLSREWWEAAHRRLRREAREKTVFYDADCGVCLWLSRLLVRLDRLDHLTFRGNDEIAGPARPAPESGSVYRTIPAEVTPELAESTVVVVDRDGRVHTRGRAVAEIVSALPLGGALAWVLRAPPFAQLLNAVYDAIAPRRHRVSELMGLASCGVPVADDAEDAPAPAAPPPARRLAGVTRAAVRELAVAVVFAAMLVQTGQANALPASLTLPASKRLEAVAAWPRMLARWDVFVPAPPTSDGGMVIDAQTRGGKSVDPLTGEEPVFDLSRRRPRLGQLWSDYLDRIRQKPWFDFQKAYRDYTAKGGPRWDAKGQPDGAISGLDAYWITQPSPAPGDATPPPEPEREKVFTHSRGGRMGLDRLPVLRPEKRQ